MPELPLVYWDADVFLSYVNGDPDRLPHIDALLGKSGVEFTIITSALSIVEVGYGKVEQDGKALDEATETKINALWDPPSPIRIAEFYRLLAYESRTLIREALKRQWKLKPADAVHLMTARRLGVTAFHTYDAQLPKYSELVGFPIGPPVAQAPELPFGPGGSAS